MLFGERRAEEKIHILSTRERNTSVQQHFLLLLYVWTLLCSSPPNIKRIRLQQLSKHIIIMLFPSSNKLISYNLPLFVVFSQLKHHYQAIQRFSQLNKRHKSGTLVNKLKVFNMWFEML